MTVTSASAPASAWAALSPPKPAPTMTMCGRAMASLPGSGASVEVEGDDAIDRQRAGSPAENIGQDRGPHQVLRPVLRIDQELDGQGHREQRSRAESRADTEHQQDRRC